MKPTLPAIRATLTQLRTLDAVARLGGVGKAAAALHLAQPTVSTQLRELAAATDLQLFEPEGRGLRITADGERLWAAAREMFDVWRRFDAVPDRFGPPSDARATAAHQRTPP